MKLADLKLTPGGLAATKKLSSQIQKGSVAQDKQPTLKLDVVGIEIGQEQSTGDTSKVQKPIKLTKI